MILSKFYKKVKIKDNLYAIYNSLIMDVIYADRSNIEKIEKFKVTLKEKTKLKDSGIYVKSHIIDEEALLKLKERYERVTGKVHIMYFILSSACNLGCKYCFIENCQFNNKKEINMKRKTALTALEKYTHYLKKNNLKGLIIFYGGEPMINWEVIESVLNYAKKIDAPIDFSMVTNATLLTPDKIKFLAEHKVEIGISIDGPKSLNDKNRIYRHGNKSVYDEIIKKFPTLKMEHCKFGLSITVSEDFLDQQDEVLIWLEKLNISSIFYNLYHYTSFDENWQEYYEKASKFLLKSYGVLSRKNIYDGRLIRKIDSVVNNEFKFSDCGAIGGNQLAIKPNGDICICHGYLKTDKYVIGNINKNSINEVLETEEIRFWRQRNTLNNKECLNCDALFICGGGCAIQAEALFGNRNEIDKPFCIHTKESLKWILKNGYNITTNNKTKIREKEVIR